MNCPLIQHTREMFEQATDMHEKAELLLILDYLEKHWRKHCSYCKYPGHTLEVCPSRDNVKHQCRGDGMRTKLCNRISNDMRIG